jgi:hypothetical protein
VLRPYAKELEQARKRIAELERDEDKGDVMKKKRRQPHSQHRYLDLMNLRTPEEAYQKVLEMASNLSEREHTVRSCIFDLQALVELELRRIYYHLFKQLLFLTDDDLENQKTLAEFDKIISNVSVGQMIGVLQPIMSKWYGDFDAISAINERRNLAAHQSDITKVTYKGRSPFTDADCLAQMYFDMWAIKQSMSKFFWFTIEKPRDQLRRYYEKYGYI